MNLCSILGHKWESLTKHDYPLVFIRGCSRCNALEYCMFPADHYTHSCTNDKNKTPWNKMKEQLIQGGYKAKR